MATRLRPHPKIIDDDQTWSIAMDVADFTPGELHVEVGSERLTVAADRPPIGPYELHEHLDEALRLPAGLDAEHARAFFDDGVLRIELPKLQPPHRAIPVQADAAIGTDDPQDGGATRTILLATDGSPSARRATAYAIGLARDTGWTLEVITTWKPPAAIADVPADAWQALAERELRRARNLVDETLAAARAEGVVATAMIVRGEPVAAISAAAAGATLLVLGAHGWGALERVVFGSVSGALLRDAPCPVLVVREDAPLPSETAEAALGVAM